LRRASDEMLKRSEKVMFDSSTKQKSSLAGFFFLRERERKAQGIKGVEARMLAE
jgi:hypothetical protein